MVRTLFLFLALMPVLGIQSWAIEIFVNGHKYDSFQDYQDSEKAKAVATPVPATLNNQQEDYIRQQAKQLGIKVDFDKLKTVQVRPQDLSAANVHQLYVMGVENGMVSALKDFYQNGPTEALPSDISPEQLQGTIQKAVAASPDPKLLIAEPGKLKIMTLKGDKS